MSIAFTPALFKQPSRLKEFFSGEAALARIKNEAVTPHSQELYFGRWEVVWIVATAPFAMVLSLFCHTISYLTHPLPCLTPSRFFTILSEHSVRKWNQLWVQVKLGERLLVPTINTYQLSSWDVYGQSSLQAQQVEKHSDSTMTMQAEYMKKVCEHGMEAFFKALDKETGWLFGLSEKEKKQATKSFIEKYQLSGQEPAFKALSRFKSYAGHQKGLSALYEALQRGKLQAKALENVNFYSPEGVCRGGSLWFISLFLKARERFNSEKEALIAVAREFESGIPSEGGLLHALQMDEGFLNMVKTPCEGQKIPLYELDREQKRAKTKIDSLPQGIYRMGVYHHSLVYCKVDENTGYLWDSAGHKGLFSIEPGKLLDIVLEKYYVKSHPDSHIYFEEFTPLQDFS